MGQQGTQEWQTEVFRSSLVRKLEEAIRESGNPTQKPAPDMERQVFMRAKTKEEYLSFIARLILHVRQQSSGGPQGGGSADLGDLGMSQQPNMQQQQQQQQQQMQMQQQQQQQGQMRMMQGGGQQPMMQQGGGMSMQQQQQQRMMMQQQQQQRMQMMQQQQQQQQQMMGGHQRPPMSQGGGLLEQRLQQQQMLRGGPNMVRHGGPMAMRPGGPPGMMRPGGPPPYITGASTGVPPGQGPSPAPVYTGSSPGGQMNPSPGQPGGRPVPSPNMAPTPSPGGGINSNVNTPMGGAPDSVADREYMDKVKQLEKYIEPLRRMITKIGTEDQDRLQKMKKLLEILSNPEKRMPLATLQKCEDVLKKMNLPDIDSGPEGSNSALPPSSFNPLLEAVLKSRSSQGPQLNHWLSRTFVPPLNAVVGQEISLPALPASPTDSEEEEEIPDVLQGEIARLEPRFKVWLSSSQPSGRPGSVKLVCQLDDQDLPAVPTIEVTLPSNYPSQSPIYPTSPPDYLATPFLTRVEEAFSSRLLRLPPQHSLTQLLTAWELSVRAACSLNNNNNMPNNIPNGASMFSV